MNLKKKAEKLMQKVNSVPKASKKTERKQRRKEQMERRTLRSMHEECSTAVDEELEKQKVMNEYLASGEGYGGEQGG